MNKIQKSLRKTFLDYPINTQIVYDAILHKKLNNDDIKTIVDCILFDKASVKKEIGEFYSKKLNEIRSILIEYSEKNFFLDIDALDKTDNEDYKTINKFLAKIDDEYQILFKEFIDYAIKHGFDDYTNSRISEDYSSTIKALKIIRNTPNINDELFCKKMGMVYCSDVKTWPLLKEWLLSKGCPQNKISEFRLRWNHINTWTKISKFKNIRLETLLESTDIVLSQ